MQSETPRQASLRDPTILRKSEAPTLAPNGLPDCDDGPIGLAARRQAEAGGHFYAPSPADPNSSLIDELERILQGDFAEADQDDEEDDDGESHRFPRFAADPLSLFDEDAPLVADDGIAPYTRSRPAERPRTAPVEPLARAPVKTDRFAPDIFDDGDRGEFGFFDEDPPRTPDFWRTTDLPSADLAPTYRRRRGFSPGYLTVAALLLLVAAGGIYSTVQFRGTPAAVLAEGTEIASPNAFGSPGPAPRLVDTTPVTAIVATPPADPVAPTGDEIDRLAELAATPNAAPVAEEPAAVPLFRDPAADARVVAEAPATPDPAVTEVAAAEPAPAAPAPAAAETPPPPAAAETTVANANLGTINDWVNLRADPSMNGRVLMVVPLGATVEVIGCPGWCEVVYNGTRGFVGPDFVDRR